MAASDHNSPQQFSKVFDPETWSDWSGSAHEFGTWNPPSRPGRSQIPAYEPSEHDTEADYPFSDVDNATPLHEIDFSSYNPTDQQFTQSKAISDAHEMLEESHGQKGGHYQANTPDRSHDSAARENMRAKRTEGDDSLAELATRDHYGVEFADPNLDASDETARGKSDIDRRFVPNPYISRAQWTAN